MIKSNKGRFKCPHEAQAVWNCALGFHKSVGGIDLEQDWLCENEMAGIIDDVAEVLHKSGLINGTIYDEDGRIEDYDVGLQLDTLLECEDDDDWPSLDYFVEHMLRNGKIRGTIFY